MGKIKYRIFTPFDGVKGWEHEGKTYRLAVGCGIAEGPNGELLACTMTGGDTEPCDDHVMILTRSFDHGRTWSDPEIIVGNENGENGSGGIISVNGQTLFDGKNYLRIARWPAKDTYSVWHYTTGISEDGCRTWGEELPVTKVDGEGLSSGVGNIIRTSKGELLCSGSINQKRPVPLKAGVARLAYAKSEEEALAMEPAREDEEKPSAEFGDWHVKMCCFETNEDFTEFKVRGNLIDNRPLGLCETQIIELKDGSLALLARAEWGGYLWRSDSFDNGYTWTPAYQTDIPNPSSLTTLMRLPDGRIAMFLNPTGGVVGKRGDRKRLAVWVSNDEMKTWYIKEDIVAGEFYLSYPDPRILSDGTICFGYDHNRRGTRYVEIEIEE
ncbi:MAG: exo-alpha-sialidase [Clostridia bacterium]|nr:exo-alpha-sialidase [Clostridia bacterium]